MYAQNLVSQSGQPVQLPGDLAPELLLVRHGQTAWSREGKHTGLTDVPLDPEGRRQAASVGRHLRSLGIELTKVLASPLSRAAETCRIAGFGDAMEPIADLAEWDYGAYEGRTTDQIRESRPGWSLWRDGVPSGEGIDDVARRADMVISYATASKGSVVIFAHAHILRVLAVRWISLAPHNGRSLALGPASTSILGHEHETTTILSWNDRSYL